jgi:hypothetical protein
VMTHFRNFGSGKSKLVDAAAHFWILSCANKLDKHKRYRLE